MRKILGPHRSRDSVIATWRLTAVARSNEFIVANSDLLAAVTCKFNAVAYVCRYMPFETAFS